MGDWDFDLLGDPIPPGRGKRGRPPHMPTVENRRKVVILAAFDKNETQIAAALGITEPTLRKHYFSELRSRLEARQRVEGKLLSAMLKQVDAGNVSAIDKLWKRLDKHDLALLAGRLSDRPRSEPAVPKLGKKAQAKVNAAEVSGKFAPPAGPRAIN